MRENNKENMYRKEWTGIINKRKKLSDNKGFSLVELIIVIAIMAILAGALAPALIKYIKRSRKQSDVNTAQELGKAVERIIASDEEWTNGSTTKTYGEWFLYSNGSTWNKTVTDDDGNTYTIYCIAQWIQGYNGGAIFNGGSNEHNGLCTAINSELGSPNITLKYKKDSSGNALDKYYICRRNDTNMVEVWVGSSTAAGQGGTPLHKLYPNVCDEYTD